MVFARRAGVSLIEVLVAVMVLAVGVIGAAGMHLKALRATHESGLQSAALQIAGDLAERMRLHYPRYGGGAGNPFLEVDYSADPAAPPQPPVSSCRRASCTPEQLAEHDIHEAKRRLLEALPTGRLLVCRDARPWDAAISAFRWECDEGEDAAAPVVIKLGWRGRNPDGSDMRTSGEQQGLPGIVLVVHPGNG